MVIPRGVETKSGWWVKSTKDGKPYPINSRLKPLFDEAGVDTLNGAFEYGAKKFRSNPCMATRRLIRREQYQEGGKTFEKREYGDYCIETYAEIKELVDAAGLGIRSLGIKPFDRVAIFAETRKEWFAAAIGCLQNRITVCTLYSTLNDAGLTHGINETEVEMLITSYELMGRVAKVLPQCPKIKTIIVMEDQIEGIGAFQILPDINMFKFTEMIALGKSSKNFDPQVSQPNDTAIIMYTSGSSGTPKGVELSHTNILAAVLAYSVQMNIGVEDRYMAFLPLAHIMELATEVSLISLGATIYFSSPHTLTRNSLKIKRGTSGDAKVARPTVMNAVPLVLDRIIKGVTQAVEKQGWLKSFIFNQIVKYKFWLEYIPFASAVLDLAIFNKVKEELGGHLLRVVVGGAPVPPSTHDKMRAIFGCSMQVGYGSTETGSCITGMDEDDVRTGQVGGPNLGILVRLENWFEGGYLLTDKPYPRGELIVGGPSVAKGYFKQNQETVGAFFEEDGQRWFRTGDIGVFDSSGSLRIIDRMKDLIKLKHGEYVSLGNAESKLKTLDIVDNICVFADSTQDKTVAVIVPSNERLLQLAKTLNIEEHECSTEELCSSPVLKGSILKELQRYGRKQGLSHWEIPAAVHLSPEIWTPDSGLVTAALKLRRTQLGHHYRNMIKEMYSRLD